MKKILIVLAFALLAVAADAQQGGNRVDRFIAEYQVFVDDFAATSVSDIHGDTLNRYKHQQNRFMRRYRWYYDNRMSVEQLEEFNKLCGRYHRKMRAVMRQRKWAAARGRIEGRFENLFSPRDSLDTQPVPLD